MEGKWDSGEPRGCERDKECAFLVTFLAAACAGAHTQLARMHVRNGLYAIPIAYSSLSSPTRYGFRVGFADTKQTISPIGYYTAVGIIVSEVPVFGARTAVLRLSLVTHNISTSDKLSLVNKSQPLGPRSR